MKISYFILFIHVGLLYFFWNRIDQGKDYQCTVIQRFEPEQVGYKSKRTEYKILVNISELNQIKTLNVSSELWALTKVGDVHTFHLDYVDIHNETDPEYSRFLFVCFTGFIILVVILSKHLTDYINL